MELSQHINVITTQMYSNACKPHWCVENLWSPPHSLRLYPESPAYEQNHWSACCSIVVHHHSLFLSHANLDAKKYRDSERTVPLDPPRLNWRVGKLVGGKVKEAERQLKECIPAWVLLRCWWYLGQGRSNFLSWWCSLALWSHSYMYHVPWRREGEDMVKHLASMSGNACVLY